MEEGMDGWMCEWVEGGMDGGRERGRLEGGMNRQGKGGMYKCEKGGRDGEG